MSILNGSLLDNVRVSQGEVTLQLPLGVKGFKTFVHVLVYEHKKVYFMYLIHGEMRECVLLLCINRCRIKNSLMCSRQI